MANGEKLSGLQWTSIILFFGILIVWLVAITYNSERAWANNPWYPTMTAALLWGVWVERSRYDS